MLPAEYHGHDLLFVVGCPRSGTTWIQRLLAAHPDVRTGQESDVFDLYVGLQLRTWRNELRGGDGRGGVGLACYLDEEAFLATLRRYMLELLEPMVGPLEPGQIFLEKTPSHAVYLPEIAELLPDARVVNVLRDARDVAASLLAASRSWGAGWAPRRARDAARMWVEHVEAVERARSILGDRLLEVRYEDVHDAPERELRRLLAFAGLAWSDPEIHEAIEANRAGATGTDGTPLVRGGEFALRGRREVREPEGFLRKAAVGGWRDDLSRRERLDVWRVARHAMARNGYGWTLPW